MSLARGDTKAPSRRKRAYDLDGMKPIGYLQDPLRILENEALQDLTDEYRTLKMEKMLARLRRDVSKERDGDGGPMASNADFMRMAKMMSDLTPEEQQRVAGAYGVLRMADRGQVGGSLGLLGPLIGYAKQNPGASEDSMLKYLTLMDSQLMKGLELSRALNPGQPEDGTLKLLGLMKEILPLLQSFKGNQQQGVFDAIFLQPDVYNRMRESGIFGGNSAAKSTIDIQLEELRGSRELQIKKWDLEMHRDELKRLADDRRTESLLAFLGPMANAFAGPVSQKMQELGQQQAAAHNPVQHNPMPKAPPKNLVKLRCSCGFEGEEAVTDPPKEQIICPLCEQVLMVNMSSTPSTGEETVDMSKGHLTGEI